VTDYQLLLAAIATGVTLGGLLAIAKVVLSIGLRR